MWGWSERKLALDIEVKCNDLEEKKKTKQRTPSSPMRKKEKKRKERVSEVGETCEFKLIFTKNPP